MRELSTRFSLSHLSTLVNLLTSAVFSHFLHIVLFSLLLLLPLVVLLSPLDRLELQTDLSISFRSRLVEQTPI